MRKWEVPCPLSLVLRALEIALHGNSMLAVRGTTQAPLAHHPFLPGHTQLGGGHTKESWGKESPKSSLPGPIFLSRL